MRTARTISHTPYLLAALLAHAPPALAAPPAAPADEAAITRIYDRGLRAAQLKQWDKARQAFLETWNARKHYQIAANLGRSEFMTGAYRDAADHLAFFLREAPADISAADRAKAQTMLDEARTKIATITLRVAPPDAEVLLDGAPLAVPPGQQIYLDPGPHIVEAQLDGHERTRREIQLQAGQVETVELRLDPEPRPAPRPALAPPPEPEQGRSLVLIGAGIGMSAAAAVTGAVLVVMAMGKQSTKDEIEAAGYPAARKAEWLDLERSRADLLNVGTTAFIGAGVLGAATLAYALTGAAPALGPEKTGKIEVHPMGAGVAVTGRW